MSKTTEVDYTGTHPSLKPFEVDRPGCRVHGWEAGPESADTVIMHHGATADHRMFNGQVGPLLKAGYRVVVMDGRGHGQSRPMPETPTIDDYADDFLAVLDDRGIDSAVYVGHSLGGYVAQHAINRQPGRCRALVVVGSTLISVPLSRRDAAAMRGTGLAVRLWPWKHLARLAATRVALRPEAQSHMADCVASLNKADFLRIWNGVSTAISVDGFPAVPTDLPVLWTHGGSDDTGNIARDAPRILEQPLSRLEYHVIPDAAHNANQDNPLDFNERLIAFLASLPADE